MSSLITTPIIAALLLHLNNVWPEGKGSKVAIVPLKLHAERRAGWPIDLMNPRQGGSAVLLSVEATQLRAEKIVRVLSPTKYAYIV